LHQRPDLSASMTFVKPELLKHLDELERCGLTLQFRHLANDVFNEIGWLDPSGHLIRLIEARTFSPSKRSATDLSLCGYFHEIALPTPDREAAKSHWEQFGFVGMDEPDATLPRVSCTSDTINVGLYDPAHVREPALHFEVHDFDQAVTRLESAGVPRNGRLPAQLRHARVAALTAPEGTRLWIWSEAS
jgi:hypothetical protein